MNAADHPLTNFFDAVRDNRRPTTADVDELVGSIVGDQLFRTDDHLTEAKVRATITDTVRRMVDLYGIGAAGDARTLARQTRDELIAGLPAYEPRQRTDDRTLAEKIAEIPR